MHARRATTLTAALFAAVALVAGCGGGDNASTVTLPPLSVTTTRAPVSTTPATTAVTTTRATATTGAATTLKRADIKTTDWLATLRATSGFSVDTVSPSTSAKQPYVNITFA